MPRFEELVGAHRKDDGTLVFPEGIIGRSLLQQATRETFTTNGFDVGGLTDAWMSDNQGWLLFPNSS